MGNLVDVSPGDLITAQRQNDINDYIHDGTHEVNTLSLKIGGTEVISAARALANLTHTDWDAAYDHSQLTSGNPHSVTLAEIGALAIDGSNANTTIDIGSEDLTTTGLGTFGNITIFDAIPILVLKDSTYAGDASLGYIEWRDSANTRLGFFGNSSSGNDDLYWKNEFSGGHIKIETTGGGEFQVFANTVLNDNSITGIDTLTFTDVDGTIAGIANKNLVDKTASEVITGTWSFPGINITNVGTATIAVTTQDQDLNITINDGGVTKTIMSFDASVPAIKILDEIELTSADGHGAITLSDSANDLIIHSNYDVYVKGDFFKVRLNTNMSVGGDVNSCYIGTSGNLGFLGTGGIEALKVKTVFPGSWPYSASATSFIHVDATAANRVINLADVTGKDGMNFIITKTDAGANTVTVNAYNAGDGTDTIQGANSVVLNNQYDTLFVVGDASLNVWYKIGGNA